MTAAFQGAHAVLSPSAADRWLTCVGSVAATKHIKEKRTSEAAALGTAKHQTAEWILKNPTTHMTALKAEELAQADGFKFSVDEEFASHVNTYVSYVRSRPGRKLYEVRLSTAHILGVPGQGGTSDCIHLYDEIGEIEVIDAKFGYIPVGAKHRQLRIYGAAAMALYDLEGDWKTIRTTIVQPQDVGEPVKTHVYTRAEIETFIEEIRPIAQKAYGLYADTPADLLQYLTPSDEACAWCPIAGECVSRTQKNVDMFEDVTKVEPDVVLLSNKRLGELYLKTEEVIEWAKAIQAEAASRALLGHEIPGGKVIRGRKGNRKIKDGAESYVIGALEMHVDEADIYAPRKLRTPTQLEEMLKAKEMPGVYAAIKPFIEQADGQLKFVPLSVKGDPVVVSNVAFEDTTK